MSSKSLREVCAETGAKRRAVQGYEKAGLVSAAGKNKYGHLLYDEDGADRIRTILFYQRIGFSIKEIRTVIDAPSGEKKAALLVQLERLKAHSKELSELIEQTKEYIAKL